MRLNANKTDSQQRLAIKLGVESPSRKGLLTRERMRLATYAAKTALAASLCWWLALRFGLHDGYWGAISAIIVLQSNFGATITASRDRILGTLIGARSDSVSRSLFGVLASGGWSGRSDGCRRMILCSAIGLRSSSRLAGVTISIVMLVPSGGSHWRLALDRVGQVILGILMAIAVSTLVFPDRARIRLRDGLAQEFLALGAFFEKPYSRAFVGRGPKTCIHCDKTRLDYSASQQASCSKPRAMSLRVVPGWREGLTFLLAQFGGSLLKRAGGA